MLYPSQSDGYNDRNACWFNLSELNVTYETGIWSQINLVPINYFYQLLKSWNAWLQKLSLSLIRWIMDVDISYKYQNVNNLRR